MFFGRFGLALILLFSLTGCFTITKSVQIHHRNQNVRETTETSAVSFGLPTIHVFHVNAIDTDNHEPIQQTIEKAESDDTSEATSIHLEELPTVSPLPMSTVRSQPTPLSGEEPAGTSKAVSVHFNDSPIVSPLPASAEPQPPPPPAIVEPIQVPLVPSPEPSFGLFDPVFAAVSHVESAVNSFERAGAYGLNLQGLYQSDPEVGGVGLDGELYLTDLLSVYLGGAGLFGEIGKEEHAFGGLTIGSRIQLPFLLSPFIGIGGYFGSNRDECETPYDDDDSMHEGHEHHDWHDHPEDYDWDLPEHCDCDCEPTEEWLVAFYPEVGAFLWLGENCRLSASGRYMLTNDKHHTDFWLFSVGIGWFFKNSLFD